MAFDASDEEALAADRLSLERSRLRTERQKLALDVRLKRREISERKNKTWKELLANPLTLAIVGGALTIITTIITTSLTAQQNRQAEDARADVAQKSAKQALQAELIKKFVEAPKTETVRENLRFLVDAGLLPDYASGITSYLDRNPNSAPAITAPLVGGIVGSSDQRVSLDKLATDDRLQFRGSGVIRAGTTSICTGFMVAPNIVATAKHCLPEDPTPTRQIQPRVTFELAPVDPVAPHEPVEIDISRAVVVKRGGSASETFSVALAPLQSPAAALPYLPLDPTPPEPPTELRMAFFAADRSGWVYSAGDNCRTIALEDEELRHLCDTGFGSSGAPLITKSGRVVAVHVGLATGSKRALRADIIRNDPDVVRQFGPLPSSLQALPGRH
jgi:V8-like Glu-specific endopeptidase